MKWISVKDRLPLDKDDIKGGVYDCVEVIVARLFVICVDTYQVGSIPEAWGNFNFSDITHWRPLPDPPISADSNE